MLTRASTAGAKKRRAPVAKKAGNSKRRAAAPLPMPTELYKASEDADVVEIPERTVLALEGEGAPENLALQTRIMAMYGLTYGLKFGRQATGGADFKIGPMEARWWTTEPDVPFLEVPRDEWKWQLRMAVPADVTQQEIKRVAEIITNKKNARLEGSTLPSEVRVMKLPKVRMGRALHVGPYEDEPRTFEKIRKAMLAEGLRPAPRHLEIYLNDPRRTKPANIKTVLLVECEAAH